MLSAQCDMTKLPMTKRVLNVTATDGQHFADVMPIEINLVDTQGYRRDNSLNGQDAVFECKSTSVARRLTEMLAQSERSNVGEADDEFLVESRRYRANIHYPEFQPLPKEIRVNETTSVGTVVFQVGPSHLLSSYSFTLLHVGRIPGANCCPFLRVEEGWWAGGVTGSL